MWGQRFPVRHASRMGPCATVSCDCFRPFCTHVGFKAVFTYTVSKHYSSVLISRRFAPLRKPPVSGLYIRHARNPDAVQCRIRGPTTDFCREVRTLVDFGRLGSFYPGATPGSFLEACLLWLTGCIHFDNRHTTRGTSRTALTHSLFSVSIVVVPSGNTSRRFLIEWPPTRLRDAAYNFRDTSYIFTSRMYDGIRGSFNSRSVKSVQNRIKNRRDWEGKRPNVHIFLLNPRFSLSGTWRSTSRSPLFAE